ncbi:MAG: hypothetical protein KJ561_08360 [Nanoarchaeota archaeon]|nr:hypothetical protein [Nanoarchaeota archaeon]
MDLVIDANILFSVLIKEGKTEEIIFETDIHLFAPEFIFEEFEKYKGVLLEKTNRTTGEFEELLDILKKKIKTISNEETGEFISEAKRISPDIKDSDYFALALKLKCPIWSNDSDLKDKQTKIQVYSTKDLANMF